MAQWTPVQANIGRGTASLMGVAQQGVSDIGKVAGQYLDRVAAEEREAQRQKERGEDVAFRQAQADTAKEQWQKGFDLQKAQADRAQTEFDRKLLSEQRLAEYNARLAGGLTRGEMSPQQAALVNAEVERLSAQGVTPDQMAGRLGKLLSFQAPKTAREKAQYIQQAGFDSTDFNAEPLLRLQEAKAKPFLEQAAAEDQYAQQLRLTKMKIAADEREGARNRAAQKAQAEHNKAYVMVDPRTGNTTVAYGPSERARMLQQGYELGERAPVPKSSPFSSVYGSKLLAGLDIGPKDTPKLMNVAAAIQKNYKLTPDEAADIALSGIVYETTGDWVSAKRIQDTLLQGLAPQRYGKQWEDLSSKERNLLLKETSNIINPVYNRD